MDRDHFIISVYCLVCEHYQALTAHNSVRTGGFAPALTDEEVITIEICGEFFKYGVDKDIVASVRAHDQAFFPQLRDRSLFVRQAANLWQLKERIQQRLTVVSGQAQDPVQVIDTLPLPVCGYTRSGRDRCFKPHADYGHCAAKKLDYSGLLWLQAGPAHRALGHDHRLPSPTGPPARQPVARRRGGRLHGYHPRRQGLH